MNTDLKARLERNTIKYAWYKVFTKRVYLPLITIQLVNEGEVSLEQLATIVVVSSIVQGLLQVPAGYIADKFGNRRSIIFGAIIAAPSPLLYAFMPSFSGGLLASILFFGGYAFQSGAIEAFMHSSLKALGKDAQYAKIMGRAQSLGLVANLALIAILPATYAIDTRLPFIIGFVSLLAMVGLTYSFVHPPREDPLVIRHPLKAVAAVATFDNLFVFAFAGFMIGVSNKAGEYRELLFQHIGISVALFGLILSAASLVGAVAGWYVYLLDRLSALRFYMCNLVFISVCLVLFGISDNPVIAISSFVIFAAYGRIGSIVFQSKLLRSSDPSYKATLLSALSMFTLFGDIIAISVTTSSIKQFGYLQGYVHASAIVFGIGALLLATILLFNRHNRKNIQAS